MKVTETQATSIIVKSKLPDADYVVNPYTGCEFACSYCYASFMGRFVGEPITSWGDYVYVKTNAVELFKKELPRLQSREPEATIFLSSVTDAWQPVERKFRLARGILQELCRADYKGVVSILTKSPIVLDDIDTLRELPTADVGVTVTAINDTVARVLEARAPSAGRRLKVLAELNKVGIRTYAFVGPLLPHFRYAPSEIDELFRSIREAGTNEVYVELMNMSPYIRARADEAITKGGPVWLEAYHAGSLQEHRSALTQMVQESASLNSLRIRLGGVLDHVKDAKAPSSGGASVKESP